jgi:hypothetical protein
MDFVAWKRALYTLGQLIHYWRKRFAKDLERTIWRRTIAKPIKKPKKSGTREFATQASAPERGTWKKSGQFNMSRRETRKRPHQGTKAGAQRTSPKPWITLRLGQFHSTRLSSTQRWNTERAEMQICGRYWSHGYTSTSEICEHNHSRKVRPKYSRSFRRGVTSGRSRS